MRFTTYTRYRGSLLDALNLDALLERLSDFLLDGGFAGGPHFHPYWGWSGTDDRSSVSALKDALLRALIDSGELTPEMIRELGDEGNGDGDVLAKIGQLLDELVEQLVSEGYLTIDRSPGHGERAPAPEGSSGNRPGEGRIDEGRDASLQVDFALTRKGMDFLGYRALRGLLNSMGRSSVGAHDTTHLSTGVEAGGASRPYEFGDTLSLDVPSTLSKAIRRAGPGVPLELAQEDLMVHQAEYRSSCATVLMLDISHSMVLYGEDRFSPAKKVALALSHLIRSSFPGDTLRVVTFGDRAREIPLARLAAAQVGPFHTNTAEGLDISRRLLLSQKKEMRQIIMITDGKPSAMTLPDGRIYTNSGGLDPAILAHTYREVTACRKAGIHINTFMLAQDPYLVRFIERVSEIARGKAYFTSTLTLGEFVMKDFLRRRQARGSRGP